MVGVGPELLFAGLFVLGVLMVIYCVEVFIEAVAQSAVSLGISGFFLAVILAGVDLENGVLGITAAFVELPDLALGTVFGEVLFVLAVAVGIAGILVPFEAELPRVYLFMLLGVPLPAFVLSLDGTLGWTEGALLTGLFLVLLSYIYWHESHSETKYLLSGEVEEVVDIEAPIDEGGAGGVTNGGRNAPERESPAATGDGRPDGEAGGDGRPDGERGVDEDGEKEAEWDLDLDFDRLVPDLEERSGVFNLGVAVLATIGLTIGSLITVSSAEGIFVALGISELAFGATVLSFVASLEELALTVEPVRRGQSHLAVGNVVGSTVFYVTANVGLIALVHPISTGGAVMSVHWPLFAVCLLLVTGMLAYGRVTRLGGAVLCGLYVLYWVLNYV
jgi:cation:H+ antiporter